MDPRPDFLRAAVGVARHLRRRASPGPSWEVPGLGRPWDLYEGSAGIGLFLWLTGSAAGDARLREAGARAVERSLKSADPALVGLLGLSGLGQILLLMQRTREAVDVARQVAAREMEAEDELLYGKAGVGTFLLSAWRRSGDPSLLRAARRRGRALAASGPPWRFGGERFVGYAHGPAGVGEFLHALGAGHEADVRRCERFVRRHSYRRGKGLETWRRLGAREQMTAWCHGAAGVLLFEARLGASTAARSRAVIESCSRMGPRSLTYCHGLAGNLDCLLETGHRDVAARVAARKLLPLGPTIASEQGDPRPGFFTGDAGVGFLYLRLARPRTPLFYRVF